MLIGRRLLAHLLEVLPEFNDVCSIDISIDIGGFPSWIISSMEDFSKIPLKVLKSEEGGTKFVILKNVLYHQSLDGILF